MRAGIVAFAGTRDSARAAGGRALAPIAPLTPTTADNRARGKIGIATLHLVRFARTVSAAGRRLGVVALAGARDCASGAARHRAATPTAPLTPGAVGRARDAGAASLSVEVPTLTVVSAVLRGGVVAFASSRDRAVTARHGASRIAPLTPAAVDRGRDTGVARLSLGRVAHTLSTTMLRGGVGAFAGARDCKRAACGGALAPIAPFTRLAVDGGSCRFERKRKARSVVLLVNE